MADKMTKKELKQPDALQRAGMEATSWLEGKEKYIVGAIVAVLVLGLIVAIVDAVNDRSQRKAEGALGAALEPVTRPVAEGEAAPPAQEGEEPPFPSQQAKDEAIVTSLNDFRSAHGGTRSATTAALPLAQALYRLGRHDEALKAFDDFIKEAPKDAPLRAMALEGKGYAHEAKGELDKALAAFDELARLGDVKFMEGMGQLHRARILILQNKQEEAAQVLAELPATHPNSAAARQAVERLNLLASQGVKVPEVKTPPPEEAAAAGQGS